MLRKQILNISVFLAVVLGVFSPAILAQSAPPGAVDITRCWSFPSIDNPPLTIAADDGLVFLGMSGAKLTTVSSSGAKLWSTDLGGAISSNLLPVGGSVLLVTSPTESNGAKAGRSVLRSLSKETGVTQWSSNLADAEKHFLLGSNGSVIVASANGTVRALDPAAGTAIWEREIASGIAARPVISGTSLLVPSASNQVLRIAFATGETESTQQSSFRLSAIAGFSSGEVISGDERGNIVSLKVGNEKPAWRFKSGGQISALIPMGLDVLAASHDNFVYYLVARTGNVVWKRRLAGRAAYMIQVTDRYALLSGIEDDGAALIDLLDGRVAVLLPFEADEAISAEPVYSGGLLIIATNKRAYGYSISGCV